jgi:hypothetical protein
MHVDRRYGPVGEWYFEQHHPLVAPDSVDDYGRLLALVQSIAEVMEQHELLFARAVRFHHPQWELRDIERQLPDDSNASRLAYTCEALLAEARPGRFSMPAVTEVLGDGFIADPSLGRQRLPDVIWLSATAYGSPAVNVATQVDAWMEYTLDAMPQPEVYRLNAPRLAAALVEIRRRTGIDPVVESTRFGVPEATGLRNQRYDDGEPADTSILLK